MKHFVDTPNFFLGIYQSIDILSSPNLFFFFFLQCTIEL